MTDVDRIIARAEEFRHAEITMFRAALRAAIEQALSARVPPLGTMTVNENMGAAFVFNEPFTLLPGQMFYLYAAPQPPAQEAWVDISEVVGRVCMAVAELPDRNSPDDWPEAMLVTHDELSQILTAELAAPQPPAQREWVGLTDEDITLPEPALWGHGDCVYTLAEAMKAGLHMDAAGIFSSQQMIELARAIEAKLREKNGGGV